MATIVLFALAFCLAFCYSARAFVVVNRRRVAPGLSPPFGLQMGLMDFIQNKFLDDRGGDFVKLETTGDSFGPGPLLLAYAVPGSIETEELRDMASDGMPRRDEVKIRRISGTLDEIELGGDALLDLTVGDALEKAMNEQQPTVVVSDQGPCPVLYFSGVTNQEMMETYNIMASEIYQETQGVHWPACAKVVEPALTKSLRQVLTEISGDHADAMRMRREDAKGRAQ